MKNNINKTLANVTKPLDDVIKTVNNINKTLANITIPARALMLILPKSKTFEIIIGWK